MSNQATSRLEQICEFIAEKSANAYTEGNGEIYEAYEEVLREAQKLFHAELKEPAEAIELTAYLAAHAPKDEEEPKPPSIHLISETGKEVKP